MAYGSATVRPYVGAVKRVALPIVSEGINRIDAPHFHRSSAVVHRTHRSLKWNALEVILIHDAAVLSALLCRPALWPRIEGAGRHCGAVGFSSWYIS